MGLLSVGSPLSWEETKKYADHIRKHGIIQFLNIYHKVKERQKDVLKWGDEVRSLFRDSYIWFKAVNLRLDLHLRSAVNKVYNVELTVRPWGYFCCFAYLHLVFIDMFF